MASGLSDLHKRSLAFSCLNLHERLADIEAQLLQAEEASPFSRLVPDLTPVERRVVSDGFGQIRALMLSLLKSNDIPLEVDRISLRWAALTALLHVQVALADMRPEQLRGYGEITPEGGTIAYEFEQELSRAVNQVVHYLQQRTGARLETRLEQLQQTVPDLGRALRLMDDIITRRGLVELRPRLELIVQRLDRPEFEIAVFGRVSSGKSSLLNAISGQAILPVGATPITAVPTRLTWREQPAVFIEFADAPPRQFTIQELAEFATEERNPGNQRHVHRIEVGVPSQRLHAGVVLVDTPGIGSLARHGTQEALAYLPRCDLAVLLADSSSSMNAEDVDLLRLLLEAGTPTQVLLSKADLLEPQDQTRMHEYVRNQVQTLLRTNLPIFPVSVQTRHEFLLWRWFDDEIEPLSKGHRELVWASLRRKAGALRETLAESLSARLRTNPLSAEIQEHLRFLLRRGDRILREAEATIFAQRHPGASERALLERIAGAILSRSLSPAARLRLLQDEVLSSCDHFSQSALQSICAVQTQLNDVLQELRKLLPTIDTGDSALTKSNVGGLPVCQWQPPADASTPARPWWSIFSGFWARIWLAHQLNIEWGSLVHEALSNQARSLQLWMRDEVRKRKAAYEAEVDVARERLLLASDEALTRSSVDAAALEEDLAMLGQLDSASSRSEDTRALDAVADTRRPGTYSAVTACGVKDHS